MHRRSLLLSAAASGACTLLASASAKEWDPRTQDRQFLDELTEAQNAITAFRLSDPTLSSYFTQAYGFAVFPKIIKGGFVVGGARGRGLVFRGSEPQARVILSQGSVGAQAGAKTYRQIMFFRDQEAYQQFLSGEFKLSAQAQASLASSGAADQTPYNDGVAIFTLSKMGAMAEASVGGQGFRVLPLDWSEAAAGETTAESSPGEN